MDLDQLKELKKLREEQLAIVEAQIQVRENWLNQITDLFSLNWGKAFSEKTILYNTKFQIESGIQDLDDKIEKLEFFVSQVSQYFSDSLEVLSLAIQGATQLSKIIVDSDGNYYANGLDMSWVQKMKDVKIESLDYKAENKSDKFINMLVEQYGFDKEMSGLITEISTLIDEKLCDLIDENSVDSIKVRSVVTCDTDFGVCAKCYGRDLARGHLINQGEAVGVIAAQSIGEPGTQLTMRTFHIGGAASAAAKESSVQVKNTGTLHLMNAKFVTNDEGKLVLTSRNTELTITDAFGRTKEHYKVPYGAVLSKGDGQDVTAGETIANWDPHTMPVVSEVSGFVKFVDIIDGLTVTRQTDELTGLSSIVVQDVGERATAGKDLRPTIKLVDANGNDIFLPETDVLAQYFLPGKAIVSLDDGAEVKVGEPLARIPQESVGTKDITGGLPRVADLFEARKPKEPAILAEISGIVSFGKETKGKQRLIITDVDGVAYETLISKEKQILVHDGQVVNRGETIVDGAVDPHDILRLQGIEALARYIVQEVQEVYRLQGVKISDKHIEVIIRQMLRRVNIVDSGDTEFITGEQVERGDVMLANEKAMAEDKEPARYENVLLGITKASLSTDSFISAASFQETTRVLTEAAIMGKQDELRGLKENVIVGRLIPAGTGLTYHRSRHQQWQQADQEISETEASDE